jgi:hypothetical protein
MPHGRILGVKQAASPLVNALIRKRSELAGELERHQTSVRQIQIDLDNIDGTLRLFDPRVNATKIKPKGLPLMSADKGQISRIISWHLANSEASLQHCRIGEARYGRAQHRYEQ